MIHIGIIMDTPHPLLPQIESHLNFLGANVTFLPWKKIKLKVGDSNLENYDVVYLDRMGEAKKAYLAQLLSLRKVDTKIINDPFQYAVARNKALAYLEMDVHGLPLPKTWIVHSLEECRDLFLKNNNYVGKSVEGVCSDEVSIFSGDKVPWDFLQKIIDRDGQLVLQQFIENPKKFIWRVDIVNAKVIVCNRRYAYNSDSSSPICNGTHGGEVVFLSPDAFSCAACDLARQAVCALQLDIAGVDLIEDKQGRLYILEVNPEPDITLDHYEFPNAIAQWLYESAVVQKKGRICSLKPAN